MRNGRREKAQVDAPVNKMRAANRMCDWLKEASFERGDLTRNLMCNNANLPAEACTIDFDQSLGQDTATRSIRESPKGWKHGEFLHFLHVDLRRRYDRALDYVKLRHKI